LDRLPTRRRNGRDHGRIESMSEWVQRHDDEGIATLTHDRPEALNALSPTLGLSEVLAYERRESPGQGPDAAERMAAFGEKR
jgi:hypothetical protein